MHFSIELFASISAAAPPPPYPIVNAPPPSPPGFITGTLRNSVFHFKVWLTSKDSSTHSFPKDDRHHFRDPRSVESRPISRVDRPWDTTYGSGDNSIVVSYVAFHPKAAELDPTEVLALGEIKVPRPSAEDLH
jgi:hypothetical protein